MGDKQVFFGVLTDGLTFGVYLLQDSTLRKIDEVNLEKLSVDDAFLWFDAFLFPEKELFPISQDVARRFGDTSPVFYSSSPPPDSPSPPPGSSGGASSSLGSGTLQH